ncbi:MAG: hypothetical protein IPM79_38205 [Polyangiaceae bacterium]|nr:hypothetical protein [Polyangiaceae bacterium]
MENAGAITYRESLLLMDPATASESQRRTSRPAHVLAHQWFGNLVTMAWWGRSLAQRGLRHLDGRACRASLTAWQTDVGSWRGCTRRWTPTASCLHERSARRSRRRTTSTTRSTTHVSEGRRSSRCSSATRRAALPRSVRRYLDKHRFGAATTEQFMATVMAGSPGALGRVSAAARPAWRAAGGAHHPL